MARTEDDDDDDDNDKSVLLPHEPVHSDEPMLVAALDAAPDMEADDPVNDEEEEAEEEEEETDDDAAAASLWWRSPFVAIATPTRIDSRPARRLARCRARLPPLPPPLPPEPEVVVAVLDLAEAVGESDAV